MTSTSTGEATFHSGKRVRHQANHYARLRKRLHEIGTRGAKRRLKNGKGTEPVSPKARKANRVYSQWSFAELHDLISYKAVLSGGLAIKVDANDTSKRCPMCGHTSKKNRPQHGLLFVCRNPKCRYTLHADLIGARNVTLQTLLVRHDWIRTGTLSLCASCLGQRSQSSAPTKVRLSLRWSPEASPRLEAGGH